MTMAYLCENCNFLFSRTSNVTVCPSCEGMYIRSATGEDEGHYDPGILLKFIHNISQYYVGSRVMMSTGKFGEIVYDRHIIFQIRWLGLMVLL